MRFENLYAAIVALTVGVGGAACKMSVSDLIKGGDKDGDGPSSTGSGDNSGGGGEGERLASSGGGDDDDDSGAPPKKTLREIVTIDPAPGVAKVKPMKPGWCTSVPESVYGEWDIGSLTRRMDSMKRTGYWWSESSVIAMLVCIAPDDAEVQEQTAHFVQQWVNVSGMTPEQITPFFAFLAVPERYEQERTAACAKLSISAEASDRDKAINAVWLDTLGCGTTSHPPAWIDGPDSTQLDWTMDERADAPSELVRSFFVLQCLDEPAEGKWEPRHMALYAVCGHDARALDAKAIDKEVSGLSDWAKLIVRHQHAAARHLAAMYEAKARDFAKEDAAYQQLVFDAPDEAWKTWRAAYKTNKVALDAALAYEPKYFGASRAAARGCWPAPWKTLQTYVAAQKPSTIDEVKRAITDPVGAVILGHAYACAEADGDTFAAFRLKELLAAARPARGPRYAAYAAAIAAFNEIKADREKFPLDGNAFAWRFGQRNPLLKGSSNNIIETLDLARDDKGGVVKSVKSVDGGQLVEFKTERWQEEVYDCVSTGEIIMFHSDGTPIYGQSCKAAGKEWVEQTHDTIWVPEHFAAAVKPGCFLRASMGEEHKTAKVATAFPIEVWANKDKKKLTAYLGVEL